MFAEDEADLLVAGATSADQLHTLLDRRVAGEPLEQVLGWAEFDGRRYVVEPGVFVPRQRTVFMVLEAEAVTPPRAAVLDLCCGVGAVGMALAVRRPDVSLTSADIDPAAVRAARINLGQRGRVFEGDLFEPLPRELLGRIDILLCNAPYVPTDSIADMPPEARDHEHRVALDGGPDGLDVHRRVADAAPDWLAPGGTLFIETSQAQAEFAAGILERAGLKAGIAHSDELYSTVVTGTVPRGGHL